MASPAGPVERAAALSTLGLGGSLDPGATSELEAALHDDPDARVRAAALGALVRAGEASRAAAAWGVAARDRSPVVRRRAAELAPLLAAPIGAIEQLVRTVADPDVTVVEAAAWALGELGDAARRGEVVAALSEATTSHDDPLVREAAVAALGAIGDRRGLPAVLAACTDRPAVRRRAVLALAPYGGVEVEAALRRALEDRDWQVRQAAQDLTGSPEATT